VAAGEFPLAVAMSQEDKYVPLVLIHGLKGSHLKTRNGVRVFCNAASYVTGKSTQFPLPAERDSNGVQASDNVIVDGIMEEIKVCGLAVNTFYKTFIDWAEVQGRPFTIFQYDWRRDIDEAVNQLELFLLDSLRRCSGAGVTGVQVVCHSNGALVTLPLLNRRPDLFHSILFCSPQVTATVGTLEDVSAEGSQGNRMGMNSSMLTPTKWLTWPSLWYLMPTENEIGLGCAPRLSEADGKTTVGMDYHNLEDWKKMKLGPYHPRSGVRIDKPTEVFLESTLRRAQAFRERLKCDSSVNYPPIAVLKSDADDKLETTVFRPQPDAPFDFLKKRRKSSGSNLGEGRLWANATGMPDGIIVNEKRVSKSSHKDTPADIKNVEQMLENLINIARKEGRRHGSKKWAEARGLRKGIGLVRLGLATSRAFGASNEPCAEPEREDSLNLCLKVEDSGPFSPMPQSFKDSGPQEIILPDRAESKEDSETGKIYDTV